MDSDGTPVRGPWLFRDDAFPVDLVFYGINSPGESAREILRLVIEKPSFLEKVRIPPLIKMGYLITHVDVLSSPRTNNGD